MQMTIRKVDKTEFYQTENLTRETFWNLYSPGCSEHFILHNLRLSDAYIEDLDLLVVKEGDIIGHIISTKAQIRDNQNKVYEVLCVGPLSVSNEFQNKGIGTALLNYSIDKAAQLGFSGMILFGNPEYYSRFGFKDAGTYKITTKDGLNFPPFMGLELAPKNFEKMTGRFFEDMAFTVDENKLTQFDLKFPRKKKGNPKVDIKNE